MNLREYITSDSNIYLAIYSMKSYVFEPELLDRKDKILFNTLLDNFDEKKNSEMISKVRERLNLILDKDNYFETKVFFKPKDTVKNEFEFRPIHTANLVELIAMVSLLNILIYEIPSKKDNYKLKLSNFSRLIPSNFYGNRVSLEPEQLFKPWETQYSKYTKKANEYFNRFYNTKEYKFEVKLDLKNFFPSVNPRVLLGIFNESMLVTLSESDKKLINKIIYKLMVCKVINIESEKSIKTYYGYCMDNKEYDLAFFLENNFGMGILQGLPQSYFFGNICMTKISEIFKAAFEGKSVYYVDDSYLYTNIELGCSDDNSSGSSFQNKIIEINKIIDSEINIKYLDEDQKCVLGKEFKFFLEEIEKNKRAFKIQVHETGKSFFTKIGEIDNGERYLKNLSREASNIKFEISNLFSIDEIESLIRKNEALLDIVVKELDKIKENEKINISYYEKLLRYYKFFKYRKIKLNLIRNEQNMEYSNEKEINDLFEEIRDKTTQNEFIDLYKNGIWQVQMSILVNNITRPSAIRRLKKYINKIIKLVYGIEYSNCSYIKKYFSGFIKNIEIPKESTKYKSLRLLAEKKVKIYGNKGISTFCKCSDELFEFNDKFLSMIKIVDKNSDKLKKLFFNAFFSTIFKATISDDFLIFSSKISGLSYNELRILLYLRNEYFDYEEFKIFINKISKTKSESNIDNSIFAIVDILKRYVRKAEYIDNLVLVHKFTCEMWKNGSKHLYFYTLHNQEHAIDLIKNIVKIIKSIGYLKIKGYDYYLLFISCYLHDISMVKIAKKDDFFLDKEKSELIINSFIDDWENMNNIDEQKKKILEVYFRVDSFFENLIRSNHPKDSSYEIRKNSGLNFLDMSTREFVAEISEGHGMLAEDIYYVKGNASEKLINMKFNKILLRFADLLDMSEYRVSVPILNNNINNMEDVSLFHWISHLLTKGYEIKSEYEINNSSGNFIYPDKITENIIISIYVSISQFSKLKSRDCKNIIIKEFRQDGFEIEFNNKKNEICSARDTCNFLCKWFTKKNEYLIGEMIELERYLNRVPSEERFYKTKIKIKVVIDESTKISDEHFDILRKMI
ncbi:MAG: hypothetical protein SPG13_07870 [Peptostreptococcus porci]|uniref:HD domain-containing protein n=1 Tax=Peptostreptococcus porci TaxID=2652282 RepID=UPI002A74A709|nr:hypothetical protein [Peptostreptococcus porci]MDY2795036.1 hypothetical protein [Peptostreptococcus porci]MDY5480367.1 hypothetical protein [Peptostreptococcus porci]